jgi:hypothetical protein
MNRTQTIEVRSVAKGDLLNSSAPYERVELIRRKPWLESIGNFSPMFCRYKSRRELVYSDRGDLSDPFRRETNYLEKLFIRVEKPITTNDNDDD